MLKKIKSLLLEKPSDRPSPKRSLELAAAALLVEAAIMDGNFDAAEHNTIAKLLSGRFSLGAAEVDELISEAKTEIENSVELYGFARTIKDNMDNNERVEIIEMLWHVVLADGVVDDYESNLIRRVSGLIYVSDRDSGLARQRAIAGENT
ncbi:MAG: TerB family tellurite resistance protein [Rhodospirillaceae bacterium]|nr:TerB family tellurite resistance protein [Rhodospirillaceae bacterium]